MSKHAAIAFLTLASSGHVREAYERYVAPGFVHHNPHFRGDAESLASAMAKNAAENPDKEFEVKHVLEEGDLVAVHGRVRLRPDGQDVALFHLFRFANDRIVELWDIGQPAPADSPNEHGMF
jgi:predicted SnoaL-like aldol condensation-catalyzing enzyme